MSSSVKTTVSCLQCIRVGWVWCSTKWHYSASGAVNTALTNGTERECCDPKVLNTSDNTIANTANCAIRFSNASGVATQLTNHVNTGAAGVDPITAIWT